MNVNYTNFINNNQNTLTHSIIINGWSTYYSKSNFFECFFLLNGKTNSAKLFINYIGIIRISNCYIDSYSYLSTSPIITNTISFKFKFNFSFYSTFLCDPEISINLNVNTNSQIKSNLSLFLLINLFYISF